jgi:peptidoglycan hydrolase-like protein with peptidoglycan-binding domain
VLPAAGESASQAWSQVPEAPAAGLPTGLFPGWTGMYPAVATEGGVGPMASRAERRRKALYAVLAIAALTALVLLAALLIAPNWGGTGNIADKDGQPTPVTTAQLSSTATSVGSTSARVPPVSPSSVPVTPTSGPPVRSTPVRTVTVTAAPTPGTPTSGTAAATGKPPASTSKPPAGTTATSTRKPPPPPTPKVLPLGVPQRDIACNAGYIVQLASELDATTFAARVAELKAAGQVPAGALAADSTKSCKIFTSQSNTLVLYAGPFGSPYDGCAARLAGPADAFIKGSNTGNAAQYISCLCPVLAAGLPQFGAVGQQGVWVGELQRVLGNRLNIGVSDLSGNWGIFTGGTKAAVREFQRAVKIPANGVVTGRTWRALQAAEC